MSSLIVAYTIKLDSEIKRSRESESSGRHRTCCSSIALCASIDPSQPSFFCFRSVLEEHARYRPSPHCVTISSYPVSCIELHCLLRDARQCRSSSVAITDDTGPAGSSNSYLQCQPHNLYWSFAACGWSCSRPHNDSHDTCGRPALYRGMRVGYDASVSQFVCWRKQISEQ